MSRNFLCFSARKIVVCTFLAIVALPAFSSETDFVRAVGSRLALNDQTFFIHGTNQYYFFYKDRRMTDEIIVDARTMGLNVIRTWAFSDGAKTHDGFHFQPAPGVFHEPTFQNLDYVIYQAGKNGLKVILALVNNWGGDENFGGMLQYVAWSKTANTHDDFYTDEQCRQMYRNYVNYVLNRVNIYTGLAYKDDPAILAWELANEPRAKTPQKLYAWIDEMATYIKSIDQNHLVSTGSEGSWAMDLVEGNKSPSVDLVSFHLYPQHWNFSEERSKRYISYQIETAHNILKKPVYCGEFGIEDRGRTLINRDRIYTDWYNQFDQMNADGALFWILSGHRYIQGSEQSGGLYPDYDGFTVYFPEDRSTVRVIESYTKLMEKKSGKELDLTAPTIEIQSPAAGAILQGRLTIQGNAYDNQDVAQIILDINGARRFLDPGRNWHFDWDTSQWIDGPLTITAQAIDLQGNIGETKVQVNLQNNNSHQRDWQMSAVLEKDDGYNFIYQLKSVNSSGATLSGDFVFRYYVTLDGDTNINFHGDYSSKHQGLTVSGFMPYPALPTISYYEIQMGSRTVANGEHIGYKGQLSQSRGEFNSRTDYSSGQIAGKMAKITRVTLFLDGEIIAGFQP